MNSLQNNNTPKFAFDLSELTDEELVDYYKKSEYVHGQEDAANIKIKVIMSSIGSAIQNEQIKRGKEKIPTFTLEDLNKSYDDLINKQTRSKQ